MDRIMELARITSNFQSQIEVLSGSSGERQCASSFCELLRASLKDVLIWPMDVPKVTRAIGDIVRESDSSCVLRPIGTSSSNSIVSSLDIDLREKVFTDSAMSGDKGAQPPSTSSPASHDSSSQHGKIAIVAMSGRFPDAADLSSFWKLLYEGRDVHRQIPDDRFNAKKHYDPTGRKKNTSKVLNGCFIEEPGLFDPKFFNMSPKEAEQSDPGQRLALETAYEALEMAGIVPDRTPSTMRDRVGVFYGMTSDDWREVNSGQNVDTYFIPGTNPLEKVGGNCANDEHFQAVIELSLQVV